MTTDQNSGTAFTALLERVASVECRNTGCPLWAEALERRDDYGRCLFCGWQQVGVAAQDVAVETCDGDWAVVDQQEIVMRGREFAMRALAVRLTVRRVGHAGEDCHADCVCDHGLPAAGSDRRDFTADGLCRYCDGSGVITLAAARAWGRNAPPSGA